MLKLLYHLYQLFIYLPLGLLATALTSIVTIIGCTVGCGHFWGYYPAHIWSRFMVRMLFLPVRVEGREKLSSDQSYVFVANHQGAFDIFLVYGFLNRNFKWMMKWQIKKIFLVGAACKAAHHIFVDKRSAGKIRESYEQARHTLQEGMSLVVFPEGARTSDGSMQSFKRGAFMLADELQLPIVPLTINGSFKVMPRHRDMHFAVWHPLTLTIHNPIPPQSERLNQSYAAIASALKE